MTGLTDVCAVALEWRADGVAVLPARSDGSKAPGVTKWKQHQSTAPSDDQFRAWFGNGTQPDGFGVICGAVSSGLDMFEFEGRAVAEGVLRQFTDRIDARGLRELWGRIWQGYTERTPSGGMHTFYRLSDGAVAGNTPLARRPETDAELDARKPTANEAKTGQKKPRAVVLIETRGEGGFSVVAPSNGRTHPTGQPWELISGGVGSIAVITVAERDALWAAARECDQMPASAPPSAAAPSGEDRPVQTSRAASLPWPEIIGRHGYTRTGDDGTGKQRWARPGKDGGTSVTTDEYGGMWVFSSSTDFIPSDEAGAYSKAAVSAVLNDGMDAREAIATYGTATEAREAEEKAIAANWGTGEVSPQTPAVFDPMFAYSDQDLGDACLNEMRLQARYAADAQLWLWTGPEKWETVTADSTPAIISELADVMPKGVSEEQAEKRGLDLNDPRVRADLDRHARRERLKSSPGASRVGAKMRSRVAVPGRHAASIRLADLDAEPGIIWAGGVPWDITASVNALAAAAVDRNAPHLKSCRYTPANVPTPKWDALLMAVWPDELVRAWAQRQLALGVSGYAEKALPLLSGVTDTGKTTVVGLAVDALGDYAATISPELLSGTTGTAMEYARFALKGVRLAFLDEAPRTGKIAQAALKNLTGGGDLHGRPPYGKPISFRASHTIIATANPESDPPMTDDAVRGRIRLIPCSGNVAAIKAARQAIFPLDGPVWKQEAPGVLAKLIMQAADVMANPDTVRNDHAPVTVQNFGAGMAASQDSVAEWYAVATEPVTAVVPETRGPELYQDYVTWCHKGDEKPVGKIVFGRKLVQLGVPRRESNGVTWYQRKSRVRAWG